MTMRLAQWARYRVRLTRIRWIRRRHPERIRTMMLDRMLADMGLNERGRRRAMDAVD
ncbi:hypothetical protein [Streptomyces lavendulocolor]|uniref:hypothetical protein n=1 Tax=Streptomyces lavendulocolor TaxID=67316 RepID=UPI0033DD2AD0